jgi:hypothetical protein
MPETVQDVVESTAVELVPHERVRPVLHGHGLDVDPRELVLAHPCDQEWIEEHQADRGRDERNREPPRCAQTVGPQAQHDRHGERQVGRDPTLERSERESARHGSEDPAREISAARESHRSQNCEDRKARRRRVGSSLLGIREVEQARGHHPGGEDGGGEAHESPHEQPRSNHEPEPQSEDPLAYAEHGRLTAFAMLFDGPRPSIARQVGRHVDEARQPR